MKNKQQKILSRIVPVAVLVLGVSLLICWRFGFFSNFINKTPQEFLPSLIITDDGTAYIPPIINGTASIIEGEVLNAVFSPDRQKIAVLNQDGSLYITDTQQSFQTAVALNCHSLLAVTNEGILYQDKKKVCHRYLFSDGSNLSLGKIADYKLSPNQFYMAYADKKGNVYLLPADSDESQKIGAYTKTVSIVTLLDDGTCLYVSNLKKNANLILSENGNSTILTELGKELFVIYDYDEETASLIIAPFPNDYAYLKTAEREVQKIDCPGIPFSSLYQTSSGIYMKEVWSDDLYWLDRDSLTSKLVASSIKHYSFQNDTLYYITASGDFYEAVIDGPALTAQKKIDSQVQTFSCTPSGDYVYYLKDYSEAENEGDLYLYRPASVPAKIDSKVSNEDFCFSTDEKYIYYYSEASSYKTAAQTGDTPSSLRTLRCFNIDTQEKKTISTNAVPQTLTSGLASGAIDSNSFIWQKCSVDNWYGTYYRWVYYDGSKIDIFAYTKDMVNFNSFSVQ